MLALSRESLNGAKVCAGPGYFCIKRVGGAKLCMQLTPHKRMHINASYSNLFWPLLKA